MKMRVTTVGSREYIIYYTVVTYKGAHGSIQRHQFFYLIIVLHILWAQINVATESDPRRSRTRYGKIKKTRKTPQKNQNGGTYNHF